MKRNEKNLGFWLLSPTLLLLLLTQGYPFFYGIWLSFTDYFLLSMNAPSFIGLQNYVKILTQDSSFYPILGFSLIYTFANVIFSYVLGLMFALLLNRSFKGRGIMRAILLVPWVISAMVMASNWLWLMNDKYGFINTFLMKSHIIKEPILFFASRNMARFSVCMISVWRNIPFMSITLLAGLQGLDTNLYEASRIDGASWIQSFFYITLPGIKQVTAMSTTLMFIWSFNGFENIYLLTEGGPVDATMVIPIYAYQMAFFRSKLGYSAALSVLLMIIMILFSTLRLKFSKQDN
jgi:multiple sugar transport system permease protein